MSVDVGTGNGLFADQLLTLPGVTTPVPVGLFYNTADYGTSVPSAVTGAAGSGWSITGFDQRLVTNADSSITYYGPTGLTGVFVPSTGGAFTAPEQFQADLHTVTGGGWTLLDHTSQSKLTFNSSGRLVTSADRAGNVTTFNYASGLPASIVSSRGGTTGERTITIGRSGSKITTFTQTSGSLSRTVTLAYSSNGFLASVQDAVNGTTGFSSGYDSDTGQVVTITGPVNSATTTLSYASGGQVSQVTQSNPPIDNGAGASTTRLSYPSSTSTLVADPTTNQSSAVSAVPHTTYTLSSATSGLVASAQDPDGNTRSATYTTSNTISNNVATSTPASGGATTYTYGSNNSESLTKAATAAGAAATATYTNTGASQYLPTSTTSDAGNALSYTYDGQGNPLTTAQGAGPQAVLTYNTDGTVATFASPGAGAGVKTSYGYDTAHNLTGITPPSGTSLAARAYTWDGFGRLATATDGRGNTTTYTYDKADRITTIHSSDTATTDVGYSYDHDGRVTQRTDASGTTSYSYDDLGNPLTVANTAGGGTITYTYDLAKAVATEVTGAGTTSYGYDSAHQLTSIHYPQTGTSSTPLTLLLANDANGHRTDSWLQSTSTAHTNWAAHGHLTYDSSGRVIAALGENGPASAPVAVVNETLCYSAGAVAPACPTTATADRSNVQWMSDTVTGETSTYTYDTANRLTKVVITGGSNPRTFSYGYDSAGNRTSAAVTGSSPSTVSPTYNAANQITSSGYSYDAAGNLTAWPGHTATYNVFEQQTSTINAGTSTSYLYAGATQNELISEATSGGQSYLYTYGRADAAGSPEIESVKVGTSTAYITHDNTGQAALLQTNSSLTSIYLYDGLGNPTALSNSANTTATNLRFDPYGAQTRIDAGGNNGAWNDNPYVYQSGTQDRATGTIKFGQRWYNPTTGTWTQQDNLNKPLDPQNANRYQYAADNPTNLNDPTGQNLFGNIVKDLVIGIPTQVTCSAAALGLGLDAPADALCAIGAAVEVTVVDNSN